MEFEFSEQLSGTNCRPMFDRSGKCRKETVNWVEKKVIDSYICPE